MSSVFVVDTNKQPLHPIHPAYARRLLKRGEAAVWRRFPFTLILMKAVAAPQRAPLRLKLDPGSRTTGIAVLNESNGNVVFAAELEHRGQQIKDRLEARRAIRRSRRQRQTRYRQPRWHNRRRPKGWLPPSLESRLANILTWVARLRRLCPIGAISMELVRFDPQLVANPKVQGIAYQQGTLFQYEVREYLLEQCEHRCVYCQATDVPLEVEHVVPRSKGGSNRISNLVLACVPCNQKKGSQDLALFLQKKPEVLKRVQGQLKHPLKDAAAVNTTRWALYDRLLTCGLPVETGSGGLTKYNRSQRKLPKTHWLDACNVGTSTPATLVIKQVVPLLIKATGHGHRQMCGTDRFGFPSRHRQRRKQVCGFQTGDSIQAVVVRGKKVGTYRGRVLVRASGSFDISTTQGRVQGIAHRWCRVIARTDGYGYHYGTPLSFPA